MPTCCVWHPFVLWSHLGLNQGPPDYESGATNQLSYRTNLNLRLQSYEFYLKLQRKMWSFLWKRILLIVYRSFVHPWATLLHTYEDAVIALCVSSLWTKCLWRGSLCHPFGVCVWGNLYRGFTPPSIIYHPFGVYRGRPCASKWGTDITRAASKKSV